MFLIFDTYSAIFVSTDANRRRLPHLPPTKQFSSALFNVTTLHVIWMLGVGVCLCQPILNWAKCRQADSTFLQYQCLHTEKLLALLLSPRCPLSLYTYSFCLIDVRQCCLNHLLSDSFCTLIFICPLLVYLLSPFSFFALLLLSGLTSHPSGEMVELKWSG